MIQPFIVKAGQTRNVPRVFGFVPKAPPTGASYEPLDGGSVTVANQRIANPAGWEYVAFTAGSVDLELYLAHSKADIAELPEPPQYAAGVSSAAVFQQKTGLNGGYALVDSGLGVRSSVTVWLDDLASGPAQLALSNAPPAGATLKLQPGRSRTFALSGAVRLYAKTAQATDIICCDEE